MRNVVALPLQGNDSLIVACDNSGGIGMKKDDLVLVPYETVAYYSFRVAVMECIAAGGEPLSVILNNFCGNEAWEPLMSGIKKGLAELSMNNVPITGSTESNFPMQQSAIGIMVLGKNRQGKIEESLFHESSRIAIIGKPLVGNEVMEQGEEIAPLPLFQKVSGISGVKVWPVGSKGILSEMNRIFNGEKLMDVQVFTDVDVLKSSGPATCFLVLYQEDRELEIKNLAGIHFHSVEIST